MNELAEPVPKGPLPYVFAGILGLLVIATLLGAVLARVQRDLAFTELSARIRSRWFTAGVFMLAILLSRAVSLAFLASLSSRKERGPSPLSNSDLPRMAVPPKPARSPVCGSSRERVGEEPTTNRGQPIQMTGEHRA